MARHAHIIGGHHVVIMMMMMMMMIVGSSFVYLNAGLERVKYSIFKCYISRWDLP